MACATMSPPLASEIEQTLLIPFALPGSPVIAFEEEDEDDEFFDGDEFDDDDDSEDSFDEFDDFEEELDEEDEKFSDDDDL